MKRHYVGNSPYYLNKKHVESLLSKFGDVYNVDLTQYGTAHVAMDESCAERAIEALDGTTLKGRTLALFLF